MQLNHEALEENIKLVQREMVDAVKSADPYQGPMTGEKLRRILNSPLPTDIKKNTLMTIATVIAEEKAEQDAFAFNQLIQYWLDLIKAHAHARSEANLPPLETIHPDEPIPENPAQALDALADTAKLFDEDAQLQEDARVYSEMSAVFNEFKEELSAFYDKANEVLQAEAEQTYDALLKGTLTDPSGQPVQIDLRDDLFTQDPDTGERTPSEVFLAERAERAQRHQTSASVFEHHAGVMKVMNDPDANEPPAPPPPPAVAVKKHSVVKSIDLLADLQAMRKPDSAAFEAIEQYRQDQLLATQKGETLTETLSEKMANNQAISSQQLGQAVRAVEAKSEGLKQMTQVNNLVLQAAQNGLDNLNKADFKAAVQNATEQLNNPTPQNTQQAKSDLVNPPVAVNFKTDPPHPRPSSPQPGREGGWANAKPSQGLEQGSFKTTRDAIQQQKQASTDAPAPKPEQPSPDNSTPRMGM